jgi:hypothetical protein
VYLCKSPLVDIVHEVVLEMQLLQGVKVDHGAVLQPGDKVVVEADQLETGQVPESVPHHPGNSVSREKYLLEVRNVLERVRVEASDGVVVQVERDERGKIPES